MHDVESKGSINYMNLAREILEKNQMLTENERDQILN
jgi:hypothetical protein